MLRPDLDVVLRPPPPAPGRVARRALALCALACRSQLEPHAGDPTAAEILAAVRNWLHANAIDAEFEDEERRVLDRPLGRLAPDDASFAGWRGEGAATLAWALGRWSLGPIDVPSDAAEVATRLDWLADGPLALVDGARVRAKSDVVQLAEMLEVAGLRIAGHLAGEPPVSLRNFAGAGFRAPQDAEPLGFAPDGELLVGGRRLSEAAPDAQHAALRIVEERRRAVQWLAGQHAVYSAVRP
jgi:hypothetical protein